jgi:hypothetical protein
MNRSQTFGAKRDHSAGRGYHARAVLEQRGKRRFQLFAVPSTQAPVEFLAAVAILQLEPRTEPTSLYLSLRKIAQCYALHALVPNPFVPVLAPDAETQEAKVRQNQNGEPVNLPAQEQLRDGTDGRLRGKGVLMPASRKVSKWWN